MKSSREVKQSKMQHLNSLFLMFSAKLLQFAFSHKDFILLSIHSGSRGRLSLYRKTRFLHCAAEDEVEEKYPQLLHLNFDSTRFLRLSQHNIRSSKNYSYPITMYCSCTKHEVQASFSTIVHHNACNHIEY